METKIKNTSLRLVEGDITGLSVDAIVKDIIELHSGHIWVESEIGRGSCFIFTMPKEKEVLDIRD